jgi:GGDEF domain-containing protein
MVCALFDVIEMQTVNDRRGYEFGNRLLDDIEAKLKSVFTSATVRRLGGDEFMVCQVKDNSIEPERKAQAVSRAIDDRFGILLSWGLGVGATTNEAERAATIDLFKNRRCSHK